MSGYVGDVTYTLGFYRELSPAYLNLTCVMSGVEGPDPTKPLRYCELGCGRGFGTVLLAAANPNIEFVGVDFNPSHIAEARSLATRANIPNVTFFETAFRDAARSTDPRLAEFNMIGIHGVYSWVTQEIRNDMLQFLRDKLLAGGLVYNSYNTLPGWAAVAPIQHLMMEAAKRNTRGSGAVIDESLTMLNTMTEQKSPFIMQNPGMKNRLERMQKQDRAYLAHEFMNVGWEPLYVTDAMNNFAEAKLTYVGSASLPENRIDLCVPQGLRPMVQAAPDVAMRELLKDYIVNKQFRRDVYVKGPQQLSQRDQRQRFNDLAFVRTLMAKELPEKFQLPIGEITPKKETIAAVFEALGDKVRKGGELIAAGEKAGLRDADVILLVILMLNSSAITPARPDHDKVDRAASQRLNNVVMELTLAADTHRFLASPVLGSAIGVPFFDRIVAPDAVRSPKASDVEIAGQAFDRLASAGQSFRRDGKSLAKDDANLKEIAKVVNDFREIRLPRMRTLGVV
jgi:SAM-dependent methyltransferase